MQASVASVWYAYAFADALISLTVLIVCQNDDSDNGDSSDDALIIYGVAGH